MISQKEAPQLLLLLSESERSEATTCHVQGAKILIEIAFQRSFKDWKGDFFFFFTEGTVPGDRGCLGRGSGRGLCLEGSSVLEPAGARSDWERDGAGCCST